MLLLIHSPMQHFREADAPFHNLGAHLPRGGSGGRQPPIYSVAVFKYQRVDKYLLVLPVSKVALDTNF